MAGYKVKLCGTTSVEDRNLAAAAGADWFGVVVETDFSPRSLTIEAARPLFTEPPIPAVALVFEMAEERLCHLVETLAPTAVQFLNLEEPAVLQRLKAAYPSLELWQSVHLPPAGSEVSLDTVLETVQIYLTAGVDLLLFDTAATLGGKIKFGGTGVTADWNIIRKALDTIRGKVPVLLAGGVGPENAVAGIDAVIPDGIDLCSGVEAEPGRRDPEKVLALMTAVRNV